MDLRQLILLKQKGKSNRWIAKFLHAGRTTVNNYVQYLSSLDYSWQELLAMDDATLDGLFPSNITNDQVLYEQLCAYFPYYQKELSKPGCTLLNLWQKYLEKHPEGYKYTQFVHYFRQWQDRKKVSSKLEHKAGEKVFVDFTGKKLHYIDRDTGEVIEVEIFVAVLPASQYTFVTAVRSQGREDFISAMNECLSFFGGVPEAIVSDNLKSAVNKSHKYQPQINKTLKDFALHHSCVVDPARAYHPKDKALVEGAVKIVYQRIFYPLSHYQFFSLTELNREITVLLEKYNRDFYGLHKPWHIVFFIFSVVSDTSKNSVDDLVSHGIQDKHFVLALFHFSVVIISGAAPAISPLPDTTDSAAICSSFFICLLAK